MKIFLVFYDLSIALIMYLLGRYFYNSRGKACNLLTGYNMRSEEERKKFDEEAMCRCYGKRMMIMAVPFICGMIIDIFKAGIGCALAWGVWIILFVLLLIQRAKIEKD